MNDTFQIVFQLVLGEVLVDVVVLRILDRYINIRAFDLTILVTSMLLLMKVASPSLSSQTETSSSACINDGNLLENDGRNIKKKKNTVKECTSRLPG